MNVDMKLALDELDKLIGRKGFAYALCMSQIEDEAIATAYLSKRNSHERLSSNEIVFLWSLLINKEDIWQYPESVDELYDMRCELHKRMQDLQMSCYSGARDYVQQIIAVPPMEFKPYHDGDMMREAIFYSGGSLYDEEYIPYVKARYADDEQWLVDNKDYHKDEFCQIALRIKYAVNEKITKFRLLSLPESLNEWLTKKPVDVSDDEYEKDLALQQFLYNGETTLGQKEYFDRIRNAICFSREEIEGLDYLDSYIGTYSIVAAKGCNEECKEPGDYSILMSRPILRLDNGQFLLTEIHQLFKSLYDVPGYWLKERLDETKMVGTNAGDYSERETMRALKRVFGNACYSDIIIKKGKNTVTDIDALCVWRNYAICIQIKSKGLTLASRRGNFDAVRSDFTKSFQAAYKQGLKCRDALLNLHGYTFTDKDSGVVVKMPAIKEVFLVCETSDEYPSLTHQMAVMLQRKEGEPVAMAINLFDLDLLARYLDEPYYMVHYVQNRLKYYETTRTDVEANCLSAYMMNRLDLADSPYDAFMFDNSFAKAIDAELLPQFAKQEELKVDNGAWRDATFDDLLKGIDATADNNVGPIIMDLLNYSKDDVKQIGKTISEQLAKLERGRVSCSSFCKNGIGMAFLDMPMKNKRDVHELLKAVCMKEAQRLKAKRWLTIAHFQGSNALVGTLAYAAVKQ